MTGLFALFGGIAASIAVMFTIVYGLMRLCGDIKPDKSRVTDNPYRRLRSAIRLLWILAALLAVAVTAGAIGWNQCSL